MPESSQNLIRGGKGPLKQWDFEEGLAEVRRQAEANGDFLVDVQLNIARMAQNMDRDPEEIVSLFKHAGMLAAREARSVGADINGWDEEPGEVIDGGRASMRRVYP